VKGNVPITRASTPLGLTALNIATGEIAWRASPPEGGAAPVTVMPGVVFFGSSAGTLLAYSTADGRMFYIRATNLTPGRYPAPSQCDAGVTTMNALSLHDTVHLIQMEYLEMPELKLTFWQAQRLWNLSAELCDRSLTFLISAGFLTRTATGAYIRSGAVPNTADRIEALLRAM
jgi:hypothetical protein